MPTPSARRQSISRTLRLARVLKRAVLATYGAILVIYGYSISSTVVTPQVRQLFHPALALAPLSVYASGFAICGAIAVLGAVFTAVDWVGYAAAILMPMIWSLITTAAWIEGYSPRGWASAAIFFCLALTILGSAAYPEPPDLTPMLGGPDERR